MQEHRCQPLLDFIEYEPEEMLQRSESYYLEIKRRHSVRYFSDRPVDQKVIENCLMAAGTAPSGANHQPWHFAVISDPAVKKTIREAAEVEEQAFYRERAGKEWLDALAPLGTDSQKPFLEEAPWLIVIFARSKGGYGADGQSKNYYVRESVGIATGFLISALHHAGLATLTHTPQPMKFLNGICNRSKEEKPFILLVTGYPSKDATVPEHALQKKPLEEICSFFCVQPS